MIREFKLQLNNGNDGNEEEEREKEGNKTFTKEFVDFKQTKKNIVSKNSYFFQILLHAYYLNSIIENIDMFFVNFKSKFQRKLNLQIYFLHNDKIYQK